VLRRRRCREGLLVLGTQVSSHLRLPPPPPPPLLLLLRAASPLLPVEALGSSHFA
jgi:hypothetical protein